MQYVPLVSDIEIPFYAALANHKINYDKLDDSARKVLGLYEIRPTDAKEQSCRMQIHGNALTADDVPSGFYRAEGTIKNVNTIEDYRNLDKVQLLNQAGATIWDAINDGTIYSCPSLLASFIVISFADLKKYRFHYWFAFPAIVLEPPFAPVAPSGSSQPYLTLTPAQSTALVNEVQTWRYGVDARQHGFFLAKRSRRNIRPSRSTIEELENPDFEPTVEAPGTSFADLGFRWQVAALSEYENGFFENEYSDDCFACFADPSNFTADNGQVAPGWMLRNLLALVRQRWKRDRVHVLCYRETQSKRDGARSILYDMQINRQPQQRRNTASSVQSERDPEGPPKIVGWERNTAGKLAGRLADLTEYMDPKKLADSSVDLNLKLMKWRISPNLDLDKIKSTKCLLLGAGTLGSYVSRNLMAWGVRKITFVDNATVSYSNPVRQPLFTFQDCLNGGRQKAQRAADALKEIYPGIDAEGYVMSVPMIGHPVTESDAARTQAEYQRLEALIKDHDVIILLMDTRESRWLPTVMGKAMGKVVMNAALGFDTYVVMRHGVKPKRPDQQELGCYFCNDVVAPQDSMQDRTLDQQCTVTRPGVAAIASALLVELLVSVLQHPDGSAAAASMSVNEDRGTHPLGLVPHQIRGFLSNFTNINVVGRSYDCCSACSEKVVTVYREEGWSFVEKALNDKNFVEELSGLKEVQRQAEAAAAEMEADFSDEDGFDQDEGELI